MGATRTAHRTSHHKRSRKRIPAYSWLGAGAVALGIGAAALGGSGVAHADDTGGDVSSASSDRSESSDTASRSATRRADAASARAERRTTVVTKRQQRQAARAERFADSTPELGSADVEPDTSATVDVTVEVDVTAEVVPPSSSTTDSDGPATPAESTAALLAVASAPRREIVDESSAADLASSSTALTTSSAAVDPDVAAVVKIGPYFPESIAVSRDGRSVYAGTGTMNLASGSVVVIDSATNTVKKTIATSFVVTGLAVAPNGRVYAAGFRTTGESSAVGCVGIINPSTNKLTKTITLGPTTAYSMPVVVTPDGKSVVLGWGTPTAWGVGHVATVTTISTATEKVTRNVYFDGSVADLAITPDSKTALVAVVDRYPATLMKVDLATGATTPIDMNAVANDTLSVTVTPFGVFAFVAISGNSDDIALVHLSSGEVLETFSAGQASSVEQVRLSADGKYLYATANEFMYTVQISGRVPLDTLTVGTGPHWYISDMALSPNGSGVYLANLYDNSVAAVKLSSGSATPTASASVGTPSARTGAVKGSINASDPNGYPLTFSTTVPGKGKLTMTKTGAFTYTPTKAARHAASATTAVAADEADTFTVTVSNGVGGTATVTVTVPILPKNSAPTLRAIVSRPNSKTSVVTINLKASDADKDTLTYTVPAGTARGTLVRNANGTLTFTPNAAAGLQPGKDTFTVSVNDGHGGITSISVTVVAKGAPVAARLKAWVEDNHGNQVGDGECVALIKDYLDEFYGLNADGWGNAVEYAYGRGKGGTELDARDFTWRTDTRFQDGDIIVYQQGGYNTSPAGHIGIWYQGKLYDQNSGWHASFDPGVAMREPGFSPFWNKGNVPPYKPNGKVPDGYLGYWRK